MTHEEKAEMLKKSIYQLYSKEGRSFSYISKLLEINKRIISKKIKEWNFEKAESHNYLPPATRKFLNKNKQLILSRLKSDIDIIKIAEELKIDRHFLYRLFEYDKELKLAKEAKDRRKEEKKIKKDKETIENSSRNYDFNKIEGEEWKPILGYEFYEVSNMGRIKKFAKSYQKYYLLTPTLNSVSDRYYITLYKAAKKKTFQVARLVGHAFVVGFSDEKSTINHKDGNTHNNKAENLEWCSQSENNLLAYRKLNRTVVNQRKYIFDKIVYKDKYEFNTVSAFSRFLGKSETQIRRYLEEPQKYDIAFK